MAFYRASGGMWTPFKRVHYEEQIVQQAVIVDYKAPITGTYLIVTSKFAPPVVGDGMEGDVINYFYGSYNANYFYCSWCFRYATEGQVLYGGRATQSSSTAGNRPSFAVYYLGAKKMTESQIQYIGGTSSLGASSSYLVYKNSTDKAKYIKRRSDHGSGSELYGMPFGGISITNPEKEIIMTLIGGNTINLKANRTTSYSWANGQTAIYVPSTTSLENKIYNYYGYSDRQVDGLAVNFYRFNDTMSNLTVALGSGAGMGHVFKITL